MEIKVLCSPFLITAIFFCVYGLWYSIYWQKKNPWYKQNDEAVNLSPPEREYRYSERRKMNTMFYVITGGIMVCLMLMCVTLFVATTEIWKLYNRWLYLIPFIGILLLIISGSKRK